MNNEQRCIRVVTIRTQGFLPFQEIFTSVRVDDFSWLGFIISYGDMSAVAIIGDIFDKHHLNPHFTTSYTPICFKDCLPHRVNAVLKEKVVFFRCDYFLTVFDFVYLDGSGFYLPDAIRQGVSILKVEDMPVEFTEKDDMEVPCPWFVVLKVVEDVVLCCLFEGFVDAFIKGH